MSLESGRDFTISDKVTVGTVANPFLSIFPGTEQVIVHKLYLKSSVDSVVTIQRCAAAPAGVTAATVFPHVIGEVKTFTALKAHSGAPVSPTTGPQFVLKAADGTKEFDIAPFILGPSASLTDGLVFLVADAGDVTVGVTVRER